VNARRLIQRRTGVGRYVEYLLKAWKASPPPFRSIRLYTPRQIAPHELTLHDPLTNVVVQPAHPGLLWENVFLRAAARRDEIFFSPSYTLPVGIGPPAVVTIHDLGGLRFREAFPAWAYYRYVPFLRYSARRADVIIAVSRALKQDIVEWLHVSPEKILVIYYGIDPVFRPIRDVPQTQRIRAQLGLGSEPFLLFVGLASKFRQTPELLEAFAQLKRDYGIPHRLLLVGPEMYGLHVADLVGQHQLDGQVIHVNYLDHPTLARVYNAAELLVYPSLSAGFPMPVMEAMASGTPVVIAGIPALTEAVGEAGVTLSSTAGPVMAQEIFAFLNAPRWREECVRKGLERAARFSWERIAAETAEVLQAAAEHKGTKSA
jgi:glycosyltransferase involved in cell wall biosynthesis